MICKKCGAEIKSEARFCPKCGELVESTSAQAVAQPVESANSGNLFFDPHEKKVAVLGSSFLRNYLNAGEMSNDSCVLSDKRVYFKGKCYNREGGHLTKTVEESTIDIKDITASGFSKSSKVGFLIAGVFLLIAAAFLLILSMSGAGDEVFFMSLLPAILGVATLVIYALTKIKLFYIAFAGGKIAFKASDYSQKEMQEFQRALRLTIDAYGKKKFCKRSMTHE